MYIGVNPGWLEVETPRFWAGESWGGVAGGRGRVMKYYIYMFSGNPFL